MTVPSPAQSKECGPSSKRNLQCDLTDAGIARHGDTAETRVAESIVRKSQAHVIEDVKNSHRS